MAEDYGLLDVDAADAPGDEFEEIDVTDTEADAVARRRDREFDEFRKRIKDNERLKVEASVFDDATFGALYKLVQDGAVDALGGPISTGKEANVYRALGGESARAAIWSDDDTTVEGVDGGRGPESGPGGDATGPGGRRPEVAVKIYRINASDFTDMREYLVGDPRFDGIGSDKKQVVLAWTRKEFANLERARVGGVRVPTPVAVERNALVMEYIGTDEGRARRLAEVRIENPGTAFEVVREYARRLYDAGLVHGDLSEYNLVIQDGHITVIDMGQAVTVHHPNAEEFLRRDCENVAAFFSRQGYDASPEAMYDYVTGED